MGNCGSQPDRAEKERSDAIDRQLEEDSKKFKKECKILLLGMWLCAVFVHCFPCSTILLFRRGPARP
jgi:hypothetical protein